MTIHRFFADPSTANASTPLTATTAIPSADVGAIVWYARRNWWTRRTHSSPTNTAIANDAATATRPTANGTGDVRAKSAADRPPTWATGASRAAAYHRFTTNSPVDVPRSALQLRRTPSLHCAIS